MIKPSSLKFSPRPRLHRRLGLGIGIDIESFPALTTTAMRPARRYRSRLRQAWSLEGATAACGDARSGGKGERSITWLSVRRKAQAERRKVRGASERRTDGGRERWRFKKAATLDVGQPVGHAAKCSRGDSGRGSAKASHTHPAPRETDTRAPAQRAWATWTVRLSTTLANCSFAEAGGTSVR